MKASYEAHKGDFDYLLGDWEFTAEKIRDYDIRQDRFSWTADRTTDNGKTRVPKPRTTEARRIGPPRSMGPIAAPKKSPGTGREGW